MDYLIIGGLVLLVLYLSYRVTNYIVKAIEDDLKNY